MWFVVNGFYVPTTPTVARVLIMNCYWILSNAFSASMWLFPFVDLHMLNHSCDPGMNPTWSWCVMIFMWHLIWFANIFLRIFTSIFLKDNVFFPVLKLIANNPNLCLLVSSDWITSIFLRLYIYIYILLQSEVKNLNKIRRWDDQIPSIPSLRFCDYAQWSECNYLFF